MNPFLWRQNTEPSIFADDVHFKAKVGGRSTSQIASKAVDDGRKKGKMSGTIPGLGTEDKYDAYREHAVATRPQVLVAVHAHGSKNPGRHRPAAASSQARRL